MTEKHIPRLLVSVRNASEASSAIAGGCDILDVKEPDRGSLGMAEVSEIKSVICATRKFSHRSIPISAALGEAAEWLDSAELPALPKTLKYVKLGLSGMKQHVDWVSQWNSVRNQFEERAGGTFHWIAVVYVDREIAESPKPHSIIDAAIKTECAGVLFDTFSKTGKSILDWMNTATLERLLLETRSAGLLSAVAGSLSPQTLPMILPLQPDIVAIRGAACPKGDRNAGIHSQRVRAIHNALQGSPERAVSH